MKIKDGEADAYARYVAMNSADPYSYEVVAYGERWALAMEKWMAAGDTLAQCWQETSKSTANGITGFMYGCAVQALAQFWVHGDELRVLHNADYGVDEEKAKGGTVNPAILTIGEEL
jgi:hypothetical protein